MGNSVPSQQQIHGALFSVAFIYGVTYSVAKYLTPNFMPPFAVIFWRIGGAVLLFILYVLFSKREKIQDWRDWWAIIYCSAFGIALNQMFFFKGLSITSSVNASVMMILTPIIVFVFSLLLKTEKANKFSILGIFLGATGAFLLISGKNFSFTTETLEGDIYILLNASSYAIFLILVKPLMLKYDAITITFWLFIFAFPMVLPFSVQDVFAVNYAEFTPQAWFSLVFLIVFTTFLTYLLNSWTLRFVNSSLVGYYVYLQPVFAIIIAFIFTDERLDWQKSVAILFIFAGVLFVNQKR
jgi:drug/metabolite transporter (DMT)-like permease